MFDKQLVPVTKKKEKKISMLHIFFRLLDSLTKGQ